MHFEGKMEETKKEEETEPTEQIKKDWPKFLFSYKSDGMWYAFNQQYNKVLN